MKIFRRTVDGGTFAAYARLLTLRFNSAPWMTRDRRTCQVQRVDGRRDCNDDWRMVIYVDVGATWKKIGKYEVYTDIDFNEFNFGCEDT